MSQLAIRSGYRVAAAALFGVFLAIAPSAGLRAESAAQSSQTMPGRNMRADDNGESRIKALHESLRITAAQEELWGHVAQSMRDNEKTLKAAMADRAGRGKTMTAVEDMKFMQIMADQHSAGLKQLIPPFEALYASMTPEQRKKADQSFTKHQRGDEKRRHDRK
jgi:protein CpxP